MSWQCFSTFSPWSLSSCKLVACVLYSICSFWFILFYVITVLFHFCHSQINDTRSHNELPANQKMDRKVLCFILDCLFPSLFIHSLCSDFIWIAERQGQGQNNNGSKRPVRRRDNTAMGQSCAQIVCVHDQTRGAERAIQTNQQHRERQRRKNTDADIHTDRVWNERCSLLCHAVGRVCVHNQQWERERRTHKRTDRQRQTGRLADSVSVHTTHKFTEMFWCVCWFYV